MSRVKRKGIFIYALTSLELRPRVVQTPKRSRPLAVRCTDDEDLKMYPVIPMEMNPFAADSLLYFFTAVSALLSVVYCVR